MCTADAIFMVQATRGWKRILGILGCMLDNRASCTGSLVEKPPWETETQEPVCIYVCVMCACLCVRGKPGGFPAFLCARVKIFREYAPRVLPVETSSVFVEFNYARATMHDRWMRRGEGRGGGGKKPAARSHPRDRDGSSVSAARACGFYISLRWERERREKPESKEHPFDSSLRLIAPSGYVRVTSSSHVQTASRSARITYPISFLRVICGRKKFEVK